MLQSGYLLCPSVSNVRTVAQHTYAKTVAII